MSKFNIGDKVKIVSISDSELAEKYGDKFLNSRATIINVIQSNNYPYELYFDDKNLNELGYAFWGEEELEAERDGKINKNELIQMLDELIDSKENLIEEAGKRMNELDKLYYNGQKEALNEIKDIINKW